jgi:hypothetical protein
MANVTIGLNSKFNNKGIKDATKEIEGLKKSIETVNNAVKAFTGMEIFKKVTAVIQGCTRAYEDNLKKLPKKPVQ